MSCNFSEEVFDSVLQDLSSNAQFITELIDATISDKDSSVIFDDDKLPIPARREFE